MGNVNSTTNTLGVPWVKRVSGHRMEAGTMDDASHVTARLLKIAGIKRLSGSGIGRSKCTTCAAAANHDRV